MTHPEMFRPICGVEDPAPGCPGQFKSAGDTYPSMHCPRCGTTALVEPFGQVRWLRIGYRARKGSRKK